VSIKQILDHFRKNLNFFLPFSGLNFQFMLFEKRDILKKNYTTVVQSTISFSHSHAPFSVIARKNIQGISSNRVYVGARSTQSVP
jgi:hypothetical protein